MYIYAIWFECTEKSRLWYEGTQVNALILKKVAEVSRARSNFVMAIFLLYSHSLEIGKKNG